MKIRSFLSALLILVLSIGFTVNAGAQCYHRTWSNGAWGWRSFHHATFYNRYYWRYRDNRIGVSERPGRFYKPWTVKRREFHNSSDCFSHRFYN